MFVALNDRIPIESLIRGIIVDSGNDACVTVAEGVGGTVEGFVDLMNTRAKQLHLDQSHSSNPDGLPDPPGQMMSAKDLATLARHLIVDYPQFYHYFSEAGFHLARHHPAQPRHGAQQADGRRRPEDRTPPTRPATASRPRRSRATIA